MIKEIKNFVSSFSKIEANPFEQFLKYTLFIPLGVFIIVLGPICKKVKKT